jgi:hypothetical protein
MATPDTSSAAFSISYEGPALDDGRMAVRDLAPALLALGDLVHEANDLVTPGSPQVNLDIRAFREGSFEIQLDVVIATAITLLATDPANAASNLIQFIAGANGFFSTIRRLRGRSIVNQEEPSPGKTRVTLDDGTSIETDSSVFVLVQRESTRRQAREVLAPLQRDGIDDLKIEVPASQEVVTLDPEDVQTIEGGLEDTPLVDDEREMAVTIVSVVFEPGNKWRLNDGARTFWANMLDREFVQRVQASHEAFRKGDILICRVRVQQWQTETGLRAEHDVTRVVEHIRGARDVPLPFENGDDEG